MQVWGGGGGLYGNYMSRTWYHHKVCEAQKYAHYTNDHSGVVIHSTHNEYKQSDSENL